MQEPDIFPDHFDHYTTQDVSDLMDWARENKDKADRMLAAVKALNNVVWPYLTDHGADYEAMAALCNAAVDYEKD